MSVRFGMDVPVGRPRRAAIAPGTSADERTKRGNDPSRRTAPGKNARIFDKGGKQE